MVEIDFPANKIFENMQPLYEYITLYLNEFDKSKLIKYDKEYGRLMELYRKDRNWKDILNLEEEYNKFITAYNHGEQYFPVLEFNPCKFMEDHILEDMIKLRDKFLNFNCYLSRFYIENLNNYIFRVRYTIDKISTNPGRYYLGNNGYDFMVSEEQYNSALKTIKENPYQEIPSDRNIDAETAAKEMQDHINMRGYNYSVEIHNNMLPRMNVNTNGIMRINKTAKFSKIDIDGLKAHEIDGHIGRRFYGYQTGLSLFIHGLNGRNVFDEGLAVWNSLNKVDKPKVNILFNSALKTILVYNSNLLNFYELFNLVKKLAPNFPDKKIFTVLLRLKREIINMSLPGSWPDDASYFCGYQMVKDMSDKERDDILKYNIGPDQLNDLPKIKKFFELNHFEPIKIN